MKQQQQAINDLRYVSQFTFYLSNWQQQAQKNPRYSKKKVNVSRQQINNPQKERFRSQCKKISNSNTKIASSLFNNLNENQTVELHRKKLKLIPNVKMVDKSLPFITKPLGNTNKNYKHHRLRMQTQPLKITIKKVEEKGKKVEKVENIEKGEIIHRKSKLSVSDLDLSRINSNLFEKRRKIFNMNEDVQQKGDQIKNIYKNNNYIQKLKNIQMRRKQYLAEQNTKKSSKLLIFDRTMKLNLWRYLKCKKSC